MALSDTKSQASLTPEARGELSAISLCRTEETALSESFDPFSNNLFKDTSRDNKMYDKQKETGILR